ncbi:inorganic triphosphatase [Mannheimia bovis]|uniref:CYTH domain-containing protein n=1 Tax=Mannheimia bovis TaxID=2770636 RepID=A0A7H1C1I1_9PAST|nr:CYTH domain-containing protein [Mannheimia bovis]QNS14836.1 CYTH domain-containing protein [Mannheimia bovis]
MENKNQAEIELKIMLDPQNVPTLETWLNNQEAQLLARETVELGNSYYDTPEQFFASQQMGLRVRSQNHQFEITLKTKGEIIGGLHIRPEYNLPLSSPKPDFAVLVEKFQLPFENAAEINHCLQATFSTDFTRQTWLLKVGMSEIEVALDHGVIKNTYGEEAICELEFEIKKGELADLFVLVEQIPKTDGMWLSGLSKAQRGYLLGQAAKFEQEITKVMQRENSYQLEQKLADFIRVSNENKAVLARFNQCTNQQLDTWENAKAFVKSRDYLIANLATLKEL